MLYWRAFAINSESVLDHYGKCGYILLSGDVFSVKFITNVLHDFHSRCSNVSHLRLTSSKRISKQNSSQTIPGCKRMKKEISPLFATGSEATLYQVNPCTNTPTPTHSLPLLRKRNLSLTTRPQLLDKSPTKSPTTPNSIKKTHNRTATVHIRQWCTPISSCWLDVRLRGAEKVWSRENDAHKEWDERRIGR